MHSHTHTHTSEWTTRNHNAPDHIFWTSKGSITKHGICSIDGLSLPGTSVSIQSEQLLLSFCFAKLVVHCAQTMTVSRSVLHGTSMSLPVMSRSQNFYSRSRPTPSAVTPAPVPVQQLLVPLPSHSLSCHSRSCPGPATVSPAPAPLPQLSLLLPSRGVGVSSGIGLPGLSRTKGR